MDIFFISIPWRKEGKLVIRECEGTCEFYGKLKEVVELEYPGRHEKKVVLFNCEWFDSLSRQGIRIHKEYRIVDIKQSHATQVYYVPYPGRSPAQIHWRYVMKIRSRSRVDQANTEEKNQHSMGDALQEPTSSINEIVDIDHIGDLVDSSQPHEQVNASQLQVILEGEEDVEEEEEEDSSGEENEMESEFSDDNSTSEEGDDYIVHDDSDDEGNSDTGDNEDTED
ncbi:hypothetical protein CDL12_03376 [Handroanthus impetiginosus]|uniref:DUF4216 domain-containing protein n=1 Tax=Handroanthus impetiginosus TaxID=429701 RepID=A0A2G9I2B7_9LAMI|nr:hypothetical protein CDL12_03376 [Handroanthus impetiginosus]